MKHLATFTLLFFCTEIFAQAPLVKQWDKRFGGTSNENHYMFVQTTDGGFLLGGHSLSPATGDKTQPSWGSLDHWVVKIDSLGNKQWDKRFGGTHEEFLFSLQQTADGGYILGGTTRSGITGDVTQPTWYLDLLDYWIVKIDSLGNKQWDKRYGGMRDDQLGTVLQTTDGGYMLAGFSTSGIGGDKTQPNWDPTLNTNDYWIVKIDSLGAKQWDKRFGGTGQEGYLGGLFSKISLVQTFDGGYLFGGTSKSGIGGDKTEINWDPSLVTSDYWIIKIDSLGNKQWDKDFGGTDQEELSSLLQTADGGYILGGSAKSGISGNKTKITKGDSDYWMVKIDANGNMEWDEDFGGLLSERYGFVSQTNDGGYLLSGDSYSAISGDKSENNFGMNEAWIVKTDSIGLKEWDKTIFTTGYDYLGYAIQTDDGCYVIANTTASDSGGYKTQPRWWPDTQADYWIIKFCDTSRQCNLLPVTLTSNQTTFCAGDSAQVCAPSGFASYLWNTAETTTCIKVKLSGNYQVTITDNNGCSAQSYLLPIAVNPSPIDTIKANKTIFCPDDSALVCAASGFAQYHWNTSETTACIKAKLAGAYYVTVTDNSGCTAQSNRINISVYPLPPVGISVNRDTLNVFDAVTQQWYLNGSPISGATSNTHVANQGGSYTVAVTDTNGCVAVSSPVLITGLDNISDAEVVSVYPNPSQSSWQLTVGNNFLGGTAEVFDANGSLVFQSAITHPQSAIAPEIPKGIYLLRISSSKSTVVRKLVRL
ncbi:MAG: T9SS type A sorting domain-containing protein [Bacteroidota bacterium]